MTDNLFKKISFAKIFAISLIVCFGVFVVTSSALAQEQEGGGDWLGVKKGIMNVISGLMDIIGWGLAQLFNKAAELILGLLAYQKFAAAPVVRIGWTVVRDFTNMFFVFGLLVIAFATVLRVEKYGYKQTLAKLIVAALLINFSLVLVMPIIDFAGLLTSTLLHQAGDGNFISELANALDVEKKDSVAIDAEAIVDCESRYSDCANDCLNSESGSDVEICKRNCRANMCTAAEWKAANANIGGRDLDTSDDSTWRIIISKFLSNIFLVVALFCLALFAFFLLVRVIYLWILLIFAPIVWLMWVFPFTSKFFSQWWTKFIHWTFFAPIYMFFIFLAVTTYDGFLAEIKSSDPLPIDEINKPADHDPVLPTVFQWQFMLEFLLSGGLLVGGLIAAQSIGVAGAGAAVGLGKRIKGAASGAATGAVTGAVNKFGYQRYQRGRAIRQKAKTARIERKAQLRRVSGVGQRLRERVGTKESKAAARAERNTVVKAETEKMGETHGLSEVKKIAGGRMPRGRVGKMRKLAAQNMLADEGSKAYKAVVQRERVQLPRKTMKRINRLQDKAAREREIRAQVEQRRKEGREVMKGIAESKKEEMRERYRLAHPKKNEEETETPETPRTPRPRT